MRTVLGPIVQTQLARDVTPLLIEWRTTVNVGSIFDAERAAIMRDYADRGDGDKLHERLEAWASSRRAQYRGAERGGVLG